jgi:hypothetical protein
VIFAAYGEDRLARQVKPSITDETIQRFIGLRLEGRSMSEVAVILSYPRSRLYNLWIRRCLPLLSKDAREEILAQNYWNAKETKHLVELQDRGMKIPDVCLQFPSKTAMSVRNKIARELLQFPKENFGKRVNSAVKLVESRAASGGDKSESEG